MATSSSDWLTALLERPQDGGSGVKTLPWLPDFAEPLEGFAEGFPAFRRQDGEPCEQTVPDAEAPLDDTLVDLLREALEEGASDALDGALTAEPEPLTDVEPAPQVEAEPEIDPIAQAFEQGKAAGREEAFLEHEAEAQRKLTLRQTFRALDQAAMDALSGELAETVIALCGQTLSDFTPTPDALKQRCLEAAQRLGSGVGEAALYLHPEDLALLDRGGLEGWKLVGDPSAERGGLRLETADGLVSDRPEDWRRAIRSALKG